MKIIGLSGKKQSGKTTVVNFLSSEIRKALPATSCSITNFADPLKQIIIKCFVPNEWQWGEKQLDCEACKAAILPCGKTVREVLQIVGTDWFRGLYPDCWVNAYRNNLPWREIYLTTDARFPNEVKCIEDLGGIVIRLLRAPLNDQHESETALDNYSFKYVVDNRKQDITENCVAVWDIVKPYLGIKSEQEANK